MTFPLIRIMQGVPEPERLTQRLHRYGFQEVMFFERLPSYPKEHPRDYIKRPLNQVEENQIFLLYTVACGRRILGIPSTAQEAEEMISLLSGRRHQVWVCFGYKHLGKIYSKIIMTRISFKRLTSLEIKDYLALNEWRGRSGGYNAWGEGSRFIKSINGSLSALSGLPEFEWSSFVQRIKS
jgi:hypothetical protein